MEALRRLQDLEKKRVPRDMTAVHKKFEEKKNEEIQKVEERFDNLMKYGDVDPHPQQQEEKKEEKAEDEEEDDDDI